MDDFDQDNIIGYNVGDRQEYKVVNEGTGDRGFTVGTSDNNLRTYENTMNVKTLGRCFKEKTDKELSNIVDTVQDRI